MKKLISSLKQIWIGRVLTVFLVGLLVFVSTAFSSNLQALAQTAGEVKEEVPETDATSPYEGGMNEFPDVDRRQDTSEADAKAGALIKDAERNVTQRGADSPDQYAENYREGTPIGERTENVTEGIGSAAKGAAEDVTKGTERGIQNIKENTQRASKGLFRGAQRAAENVPGAS